jgi:hypothetical protein
MDVTAKIFLPSKTHRAKKYSGELHKFGDKSMKLISVSIVRMGANMAVILGWRNWKVVD